MPRDPDRIPEALDEIRKTWERYPDLRLGQLMVILCGESGLFYVEDDDLLDRMKGFA